MHLHRIKCLWIIRKYAMAMVQIDDATRDELRKYKAEHGDTYDEAVTRLLVSSGWYDD